MKPIAFPGSRLDRSLAGLALLLAAAAGWPWLMPDPAPNGPGRGSPGPMAEPAIAALPPFADFSALVDRPLFSSSRRGSATPASAGRAAGIAARYHLVGVAIDGTDRQAWIADGARHFEVRQGGALDGWQIDAIEQDRLRLSSPEGEAELILRPIPASPPARPEAANPNP